MSDSDPVRCRITHPAESYDARGRVRAVARAVGFDLTACAELAVVVSELASNISKYGVRGVIVLRRVHSDERGAGLEIVARDEGPPAADFAAALRDGWTDSGPVDLGEVARWTDELRYVHEERGRAIVALRWGRRGRAR